MSKKIGIDLDGVLSNFNIAYIDLCIKLTGKNLFPLKPFEIPCWDYPEYYGYTKEEVSAVWKDIKSNPYFWTMLPAYDYAASAIQQLSKYDKDEGAVYFITTRVGVNPKQQSIKWLIGNGFIGHPTVIVSSKKGPIAEGLQLDVFIDDKVENCVEVAKYMGTACKVYMLNQGWNKTFEDLRSIKRVDTVDEFLKETLD